MSHSKHSIMHMNRDCAPDSEMYHTYQLTRYKWRESKENERNNRPDGYCSPPPHNPWTHQRKEFHSYERNAMEHNRFVDDRMMDQREFGFTHNYKAWNESRRQVRVSYFQWDTIVYDSVFVFWLSSDDNTISYKEKPVEAECTCHFNRSKCERRIEKGKVGSP